jgi:hypothetical protein
VVNPYQALTQELPEEYEPSPSVPGSTTVTVAGPARPVTGHGATQLATVGLLAVAALVAWAALVLRRRPRRPPQGVRL